MQSVQQRLIFIFTSFIIISNLLVVFSVYIFIYESFMKGIKEVIQDQSKTEFITHFHYSDLDSFNSLAEDEVFQVYDLSGKLLTTTLNGHHFPSSVNPLFFELAKHGDENFEIIEFEHVRYITFYFSLTDKYVGKIAVSLIKIAEYHRIIATLLLIIIPIMMLISYLLSRFLVTLVMKKITNAYSFQKNFSSNVTHELRSPLASLKGNLEVALRKKRTQEEYVEFLKIGNRETDRVISLLDDLYLLANSNFKVLSLFREQVDLNKLMNSVIEEHNTTCPEKKLAPLSEKEDPMTSLCDVNLIWKVFENLIENALKYSVDYKSIHIKFIKTPKELLLKFENRSSNINSGDVKKLGEPFHRGPNAELPKISGTGLGLNIIKYIIYSHGGKTLIHMPKKDLFIVEIALPSH